MPIYEFSNATIAVDEPTLTIRRRGLRSDWSTPLTAVGGSRLVLPRLLVAGHLQVVVMGEDPGEMGRVAAVSDARCVVVEKAHVATAESLHGWLMGLGAHNRAAASSSAPSGEVRAAQAAASPGLIPFDLWGAAGWHGTDVVGESHYRVQLQRIVRVAGVRAERGELDTSALLRREPVNRHDPNAVEVVIEGSRVGYLSRDNARRYARRLDQLEARGLVARVPARIGFGPAWDEPGKAIYGVQVDLAAPSRMMPGNDAPSAAFVMIPAGPSIRVKGEENHSEFLRDLVARVGAGPDGTSVYATLHETARQTTRGPGRAIVEVRIDGQRVGELTPQMSDSLLPVIRHAEPAGVLVGCEAVLSGNRIDQQVTLHTARAKDLDEAFLAQIDGAVAV